MDPVSSSLRNLNALVFMGVCGCGKSTIGKAFSIRRGLTFIDADDHHPPANIEKMSRGEPLDDRDREPWYENLNRALKDHAARGEKVALACSALRKIYRDWLQQDGLVLQFVLLEGSHEILSERLKKRKDHFMPPTLLASQLETLEKPADAIVVDIRQNVESMLTNIDFQLMQRSSD